MHLHSGVEAVLRLDHIYCFLLFVLPRPYLPTSWGPADLESVFPNNNPLEYMKCFYHNSPPSLRILMSCCHSRYEKTAAGTCWIILHFWESGATFRQRVVNAHLRRTKTLSWLKEVGLLEVQVSPFISCYNVCLCFRLSETDGGGGRRKFEWGNFLIC